MRSRSLLSLPSMILYSLTLAAELPVLAVRFLIMLATATAVLELAGEPAASAGTWTDLALLPFAWSIIALITPAGSGWWWRQHAGGRAPSRREREAYLDAIDYLQAQTLAPLPLPKSWFVIDEHQPEAAVCGDALMISRGLIETDHLAPVLAHELGHLATHDARLTAALNRLIINPPPRPPAPEPGETHNDPMPPVPLTERALLTITLIGLFAWTMRRIFRFAKGGTGLRVTAPLWGAYWREREYTADQYAARLGQAEELADFLETHAMIHDHPVPFVWLTEHTHPPSELRVDKLRNTPAEPQSLQRGEPLSGAPDTPPLTA